MLAMSEVVGAKKKFLILKRLKLLRPAIDIFLFEG